MATLVSEEVQEGALVLGIPRGGVVVAAEIAKRIRAEMDVILVRKIGIPNNPELAAAAVSEDGEIVFEEEVMSLYGVSREYVESEAEKEMNVIRRRAELYRGGRQLPSMDGRTVVIVDDGIATGTTMMAAVRTVARRGAHKVIVAIPVAPLEAIERIKRVANSVISLLKPAEFMAIGEFYRDFTQVSDEEVVELLERLGRGS